MNVTTISPKHFYANNSLLYQKQKLTVTFVNHVTYYI